MSKCELVIKEEKDKEEKRKLNIYNIAISLMQKDIISNIEEAIDKFESIQDWKDSKEKIAACKSKIADLKRKAEEKEKNDQYNKAIELIGKKSINDLSKAIDIFEKIKSWKDSKQQIAYCQKEISKLRDAAFWNIINNEISIFKTKADDESMYSQKIKMYQNNAFAPFLNNPFYILGLSCCSEQSKILDVKDKIEKFSRLKLSNAYKSSFDLKNIANPPREVSNIQSAIIDTKDIKHKWLWFFKDEYCCWWESDKIFDVLDKQWNDEIDYDLLLACYIHLIILDTDLIQSDKWNKLIAYIDRLLNLPSLQLIEVLRNHIHSKEEQKTIGDMTTSFAKAIISPFIKLCENANSIQVKNLKKIKIFDNKQAKENIYSSLIMNLTNKIYPLENFVSDFPKQPQKEQIDKLIELSQKTETDLFETVKYMSEIVGNDSTYSKRIKKKYRDVYWDVTLQLHIQNIDDRAIPFVKKMYIYCTDDDKQILINTYGHEKLGIPESQLSPSEMNSIAIKCDESGDVSKSIYWFKKAAEAGEPYAQSNLAFRYYEGKGVSQNKSTAKMWWTKAANQGNEAAQEALRTMFTIPHEHYDLGYISIGWGEKKYIEVALNLVAYVRLLDDYNFRQYISGGKYSYYGGCQTQTPCRISIPNDGHWHAVVDNDGDQMGTIQSLSCYTRTISNY